MIYLSSQAEIARNSLLPADRERIDQAFRLLEAFPGDAHARGKAKKIPEMDDGYILASGNLRIIFRADESEGDIEVVDIFTRDRLERMKEYAG